MKRFVFIAALLDPRFKKLTFKHDSMLSDAKRREAIKWLTAEFNKSYKGKATAEARKDDTQDEEQDEEGQGQGQGATSGHRKRRKVSSAGFFSNPDDESGSESEVEPAKDELKEYLALPQIKYKSENDAMIWWMQNKEQFPNLEVMARQYLGCPATSASVERLFSKVGIAFSAKRKSSEAETLENLMFANANL